MKRLERRLRKRDVRFLAALGSLAVIGTVAGIVSAAHGSDDAAPRTCVTVDAAGVMGGATWHYCGAEAIAYCRAHATSSRRLADQCAELPRRGG